MGFSFCLSVCLSVRLSVCLCLCLSVCLCVCLSVCLTVCLSVCLFFCLCVFLSVCLCMFLSLFLSLFCLGSSSAMHSPELAAVRESSHYTVVTFSSASYFASSEGIKVLCQCELRYEPLYRCTAVRCELFGGSHN